MGVLCMMLAGVAQERAEVVTFTESLAKLRTEFRTVQIDFTLKRADAVSKTPQGLNCRFIIFREKNGTQRASLTLSNDSEPNNTETWVLRGDDLYELNSRSKVVTKHTGSKNGFLDYVASALPAVWLLDRNEVGKHCNIQVLKRGDVNYSYLAMKMTSGETYRFAVVKRDRSLRRVYITLPNGDTTQLDVTRWVVDEAIDAKDFPPDPTILPDGWRMEEWPGWKQFWKKLAVEQKAQRSK